MSSPPLVTSSVTTGAGSTVEVTNGSDGVVSVWFGVGVGSGLGVGEGDVEVSEGEGEGSGVGD